MPFGKHKGKEVSEVPKGYLRWLRKNADLFGSLASEVDAVLGEEPPVDLNTLAEAIVGTWPDEEHKPISGYAGKDYNPDEHGIRVWNVEDYQRYREEQPGA